MKKIAIIGGTSGFGKWLVNFIKNNVTIDIDIWVSGTDSEKGQIISNQLGVIFTNDNIQAVEDADLVIVSVPISMMEKVIKSIGQYIKPGSVLMDVCSVKMVPSKAMQESVKDGVIVIPTHPMFGPYVNKIIGQVIVLTPDPVVKQSSEYKSLKIFLEKLGAKVIETSPEHHDEYMSVVQGLTHFNLFVMAETMRRLKFDIEYSQNFVSPVYKIVISTIARYMNQNPSLYAQIQINNPLNLKVQELFLKVASDFKSLTQISYEKGFVDMLTQTKDYFGAEAKKGQRYTDKIIYLIGKQLEKYNSKLGQLIHIESIYGKGKVSGKLEQVNQDSIIIDGNVYYIDERIID